MIARTVVALLLCFSPWMSAQQSTSRSTRTAQIRIRGCVTGTARYTFMQAGTGAEYALAGDPARFSTVRDKLIEVNADEYAPKSGELPSLDVKNLRVVADQCPIHPGTASRTPKPGRTATRRESPSTPPYVDPGTATQTPPNINNPNIPGDSGAPSPGTGNTPKPPR